MNEFMHESVNVAFASDDNYAPFLGTALCSLFENKKKDYRVGVFVVDGGISYRNKSKLKILEDRYQFEIIYIIPDEDAFKGLPKLRGSFAAYYRIIIGRLLPEALHKIIYLDCDILVLGDIKELYDLHLGGSTVAAVPDPVPAQDSWDRLQIGKGKKLFCSGVILIDLDAWRAKKIEQLSLDFMHNHTNRIVFHDQDILNAVLQSDYKEIPEQYDFIPLENHIIENAPTFIVHFAGEKPWCRFSAFPCPKYRKQYFYYLELTPWRGKKYRKFMSPSFARRYHIYSLVWWVWDTYKKAKNILL